MKDIILNHVISEYGQKTDIRTNHYSYCKFPEEACTCKNLEDITYDTPLIAGGYIDSFSMASTVVFLENTFNIKIKDIDIAPDNFNSVNRMCLLVEKYI